MIVDVVNSDCKSNRSKKDAARERRRHYDDGGSSGTDLAMPDAGIAGCGGCRAAVLGCGGGALIREPRGGVRPKRQEVRHRFSLVGLLVGETAGRGRLRGLLWVPKGPQSVLQCTCTIVHTLREGFRAKGLIQKL